MASGTPSAQHFQPSTREGSRAVRPAADASHGVRCTVSWVDSDVCCHLQGQQRRHMRQPAPTRERQLPAGRGQILHFTFVREPLRRFISGYSEIEYRVSGSPQAPLYASCRSCYNFLSQTNGTTRRAMAFVEDFMQGCVASRTCCQNTAKVGDMHVISQVGFVRAFLQRHNRLDFVGRLEHLADEWARIGEIIPGWPVYDTSFDTQHAQTDAASGSPSRQAMDTLLAAPSSVGASASPHRTALCRVLLPDYSCFGIPLPTDCADAIGANEYHNGCSPELRRLLRVASAAPLSRSAADQVGQGAHSNREFM